MIERIQAWVCEVAGLAPGASVQVREEAHCPDPSCPLRRTVLIWTDAVGQSRHAIMVKPLAYVRRPDVERALRLFVAKN